MYRNPQGSVEVIVPVPMMLSDGLTPSSLEVSSFTSAITKPDGTKLENFTAPTITNPLSNGTYICDFPTAASSLAFTDVNSGNPYNLSLDHPGANVEPTSIPIWISDTQIWELAKETTVGSLDTRVASLDTKVSSLETRVTSIATEVGSTATNVSSLHTRVASVDNRVAINTAGISTNLVATSSVDARVALNTAGIAANLTALSSLDVRVTSIGVEVGSNATNISSLHTRVSSNASAVSVASLHTRVTSLDTRVTSIGVEVSSNATALGTNLTAINSLDTRVTSVGVEVSSNATAVSSLAVGVNVTRINSLVNAAAALGKAASVMVSGTAIGPTLTVSGMTTDLTETTDGHHIGKNVYFASDALENQVTTVISYFGANKQIAYTVITEPPASGTQFILV